MPLLIREEEVAALLTMPEAIDAVEAAFSAQARGEGANQPRSRFWLPSGVFHHMAAALPARGVVGTKTYTSFTGGTRFTVQLYSSDTGEFLALIEADRLGQQRTGAATGVAARHLARPNAGVAALLGTGWQARSQAEALHAALPSLGEIRAYGRKPEKRAAFCDEMSAALDIRVTPADSVETAVRDADIIVTATTAREPILRGEWLPPGAFVAAVGANRLTAREIDEETVGRAAIVAIDDPQQAHVESGELLFAIERRRFSWENARPLSEIVAGRAPGREDAGQIVLFKSLGIALEDMAVAALVYEKALQQGLGVRV